MPSKPNKPAEPVRPAMVQEKAEPSAPAAAPTVLLTDDTEEQVADYRILGELFGTYIMAVSYTHLQIIVGSANGQDPDNIQQSTGCTGSCSSCSGCGN